MRKLFGAIAVAAAMLAAGAAHAQDQQNPDDQGTQVDPGADQGYSPQPGADQPAAEPEGDTGMQPVTPSAPDQGDQDQKNQGQGQCQCPCPQEQQQQGM